MENKDFKYILQDMAHVYFGKELTYSDMMEMDETPFKFKAIINNYFVKDTEIESKMLEHIMNMTEEEFSYQVYDQLKLKVKLNIIQSKTNMFGKEVQTHVYKDCSMREFYQKYQSMVAEEKAYVEEFSISKLALMAIGI